MPNEQLPQRNAHFLKAMYHYTFRSNECTLLAKKWYSVHVVVFGTYSLQPNDKRFAPQVTATPYTSNPQMQSTLWPIVGRHPNRSNPISQHYCLDNKKEFSLKRQKSANSKHMQPLERKPKCKQPGGVTFQPDCLHNASKESL